LFKEPASSSPNYGGKLAVASETGSGIRRDRLKIEIEGDALKRAQAGLLILLGRRRR
jgi:hypothetical protein